MRQNVIQTRFLILDALQPASIPILSGSSSLIEPLCLYICPIPTTSSILLHPLSPYLLFQSPHLPTGNACQAISCKTLKTARCVSGPSTMPDIRKELQKNLLSGRRSWQVTNERENLKSWIETRLPPLNNGQNEQP
uniref:Uncharacterized protein n=1 Tax=Rousettus aegyptiacus TaxID=9407 RepID=A0A7J8CHX4_ROUAE|nr:hypothetical protein HJG63_009019 [Rousettus aegyptiacus]